MAHELSIKNGKAEMMYVGDLPWHGLGTKLDKPATAREAIVAAGLDWTVEKAPMFAKFKGNTIPVPNRFLTVRQYGNKVINLGFVGKDYTPLQNVDAFNMFDPIVGKDAAIYHTAGALFEGRRVWILAKLPGVIRVTGEDISEKYVLLFNNHTGDGAALVKLTSVRVVCNNTLQMALTDTSGNNCAYFIHTSGINKKIQDASEMLGLVQQKFDEIAAAFAEMRKIDMTESMVKDYYHKVYPNPQDVAMEAEAALATTRRDWCRHFFENGQGNLLPGVRGTLWAAYNGATDYIDHRKVLRQSNNGRANSSWFGESSKIKSRAYNAAVALVPHG